ncbi:MAG: hypothetical protein AB1553_04525 [Nitrospirota bacterium]
MEKKRFTEEEKAQARAIDLPAYLESKGIKIKLRAPIQSPFRVDRRPSFSIYQHKKNGDWVGYDYSQQKTYDAIAIVSGFTKLDFVASVKDMLNYINSPQQQTQATTTTNNRAQKEDTKYNDDGLPIERTTSRGNTFTYNWIDSGDEYARGKALDHFVEDRKLPAGALNFLLNEMGCRLVEIKNQGNSYDPRLFLGIKNVNGGWAFKSLDKYGFDQSIPPTGASIAKLKGDEVPTLDSKHANVVIVESLANAGAWRYALDEDVYFTDTRSGDTYLISLNSANNAKDVEGILNDLKAKGYESIRVASHTDYDPTGEDANTKIVGMVEALQAQGINIEIDQRERKAIGCALANTEKQINTLLALQEYDTKVEKIKDLKGQMFIESEIRRQIWDIKNYIPSDSDSAEEQARGIHLALNFDEAYSAKREELYPRKPLALPTSDSMADIIDAPPAKSLQRAQEGKANTETSWRPFP